jgi:hypothetical protein
MAGNLLMSVSQSEKERAIFRSRRMFQSDQESNIATAEYRTKLDIARNALQMNMSYGDVVKLTGLTLKEVENLEI